MSQIAVIGAGAWGTALSIVLGRKGGHRIRLWVFEKEVRESIAARRVNELFLPGQSIPENVSATGNLAEALRDAEIVVSVMPSQHSRRLFQEMRPHLKREMLLVKVYLPAEMRTRLLQEAEVFRARVVDAAPDSYTLEATGDPEKLEAFLGVLEHYGRLETARTGTVALLRGMNPASRNGNGAKGSVPQPQGGPILI